MGTTAIILLILLILSIGASIIMLINGQSWKERAIGLRLYNEQLETRLKSLEPDVDCERELNALIDMLDAGVIVVDRQQAIERINDAGAKLFKKSAQSALGMPFINLVRDHEMEAIVQKCLNENQPQTGWVFLAGSKQYFELTAVPIPRGVLVLVRDLTRIRHLEKTRQDFIANISHELRTPIASCKAIVETLQDGAIHDETAATDFLERMHIETDKLTQMVNELSELSRIESGQEVPKLETVNMAEVIERVTSRLSTQADRAGLEIKLEIPYDLPAVTGDPNAIEQVLVNLIHNAIKFTPTGGEITVSCIARGGYVLTSISDTGVGIPESDQPHIFERFYKVDKARSGGGTGLGLAIAKHIIQSHNGEIEVGSTEGKGSTFTFSLPAAGLSEKI